jgi:chromosome segregation ATPase
MTYVKGRGQRRDRPATNDMETLKAWCQWKHKETPPIDQDELDFVKAIEDAISQVGNFKARYYASQAEVTALSAELRKANATIELLKRECDAAPDERQRIGNQLLEARDERDAWKAEAVAARTEVGALKARVTELEQERDELRNYAGAAGYPMGQIEHMGKLLKAAQDRVVELEQERDEARDDMLAEHQAAVDMFAKYDALRDRVGQLEGALEKIADPRKRDHQEPDAYTQLGCVMHMAAEALAAGKNGRTNG